MPSEEKHEYRADGLRSNKQWQNLHNPGFFEVAIRVGPPELQVPSLEDVQRELQVLLQLPLNLQRERPGSAERQAQEAQHQHLLRSHRQSEPPGTHQDLSRELSTLERTNRNGHAGQSLIIQ